MIPTCAADKFSRRASILMVLMLCLGAYLGKRDSDVLHRENEISKRERAAIRRAIEQLRREVSAHPGRPEVTREVTTISGVPGGTRGVQR